MSHFVKFDLDQAVKNSVRSSAKWPSRNMANRLEPECWPEITASFPLELGATVFTIGSCFARHIESRLNEAGFHVPSIDLLHQYRRENDATASDIVNKYTPVSIWQELSWVKKIIDRDGKVSFEDIEPFLLHLNDDLVYDMHRNQASAKGLTRETALRQRQSLFDVFKLAFECDVCIITPGLIEAWYDNETGQYIEFSPVLRQVKSAGRFEFRRLKFQECYQNLADTIELLTVDGDRKILITTSPIPMLRTFTKDDAIVANTHAKSVLRAAVGEITDAYPNVDYFPSFESIMLTKDAHVWNDDLAHVNSAFVQRVMQRVVDSYVPDQASDESKVTDILLQVSNLVGHGRELEARELFRTIEDKTLPAAKTDLALAKMFLKLGDEEKTRLYAESWLTISRLNVIGLGHYACGRIFECLGDEGRGTQLKNRFLDQVRKVPRFLVPLLQSTIESGREEEFEAIVGEFRDSTNEELRLIIARAYCERTMTSIHHGQLQDAKTLAAQAVEFAPNDKHIVGVHNTLVADRMPPWLMKAANISTPPNGTSRSA